MGMHIVKAGYQPTQIPSPSPSWPELDTKMMVREFINYSNETMRKKVGEVAALRNPTARPKTRVAKRNPKATTTRTKSSPKYSRSEIRAQPSARSVELRHKSPARILEAHPAVDRHTDSSRTTASSPTSTLQTVAASIRAPSSSEFSDNSNADTTIPIETHVATACSNDATPAASSTSRSYHESGTSSTPRTSSIFNGCHFSACRFEIVPRGPARQRGCEAGYGADDGAH